MLKVSLAYLAGALSIAGVVFYAGTRTNAAMFFAGILVTLAAAAAALSSKSRMERAARILLAIAGTAHSKATVATVEPITELEQQVISALENMRSSRTAATRATLAVSRSNPGMGFEAMFRAALNSPELKARKSAGR